MHTPVPITRELLLVGGGHTHALVLKMWGMTPLPGVRVTVINPHPTAPYSGMLPGFVAGHYTRDELDIDLVRLARFANARVITDRAVQIDTNARIVTLQSGRKLTYRIASIDIGITSAMPEMQGFIEHAIPAKPLDRFASDWDTFRRAAIAAKGPTRAAVIGGGVAGIELALAMSHALHTGGAKDASVALIDRSKILPELRESRRAFFRDRLADANVDLREFSPIEAFHKDHIALQDGTNITSDFTVGVAGARAQNWLEGSDLALENGYIKVDANLRSTSATDVFAVGDCAHLTHAPVPKAGVYAVREAPILYANLVAALSGKKLQEYQPQKDYLKLISLGRKSALADKWGRMFHGRTVWRLKNRIDQKFMAQFRDLKPMALPSLPVKVADGVTDVLGDRPLCGGCGAKVAPTSLAVGLTSLPDPSRSDILSLPGDDAATLAGPDGKFQVISTDHLRGFTNDPALMARIAANHALGDIWAMGAAPQAALSSIILPRLSPELQQDWLGEILAAAGVEFRNAGADIVGGHTSMGAELCVGFTVTGLRTRTPIGKSGAQPGDALVLTKPIGSGTILAAEMAMAAKGPWVLNAYNWMAKPQGDWAAALSDAHAMTDVTGFGLAGHLNELAMASGVGISLELAQVPFLDGAVELATQGVSSTIYAANRDAVPGLSVPDTAQARLLFDPQTAGGLLAAVPHKDLATVLAKLGDAGCIPAVIGTCTAASSGFVIT